MGWSTIGQRREKERSEGEQEERKKKKVPKEHNRGRINDRGIDSRTRRRSRVVSL